MGKDLVIVESPAKAKTISKYLGNNYVVKSSFGHVRDLPISTSDSKKTKESFFIKRTKKINKNKNEHSTLVKRIGIDPWNDWKAQYEILPGKTKIVNELKKIAKQANHIYLATDLDREGEAIAWHLKEIIGGTNKQYRRVVFNEITKYAIDQSFKKSSELNIDRVNAQQARRFMDRIVGYMVSPLLWEKIARGLSAGRVQSVALRMIVEREREIKSFISEEFWKISVDAITSRGDALTLKVTHQKDNVFYPKNREQTMAVVEILKNTFYEVLERKDKLIRSKPNAPFITATLQQAASTRLNFSVKKTMIIAQRLYEEGYITYMRTDSTNLSQDAVKMVRNYIRENFGNQYLSEQIVEYDNKNKSQEAHEAIRPSDVSVQSKYIKNMESDAVDLYSLIWKQFVACQMTTAKYDATSLIVGTTEDFRLKVRGRILRFDGWTKVLSPNIRNFDNDQKLLPTVKQGDKLSLVKIIPMQHFTNPPTRFNESSLVKELEKRGIGRPSTYASIISTIQDRGYVNIKNRFFYAKKIGEIVTDRLKENFHKLMDYGFTAQMENQLDEIANHEVEWKTVLDNFFIDFTNQLNKAKKDPEHGGMKTNQMVITNIDCPTCGSKMAIRTAITGVFLSCSNYILSPKERCKTTINLLLDNEISKNEEVNPIYDEKKHRCKKCGTAMDSYLIDPKRKLYVCGNNPTCDGYEKEDGNFLIKVHSNQIIECEKCHSEMHLTIGRFGKYMYCTNEDCKNTRKILCNGKVGPPKEDPVPFPELPCKRSKAYFVLHNGTSGIFLAANTFPRSRETRAPLVEELYRFRERLPEHLRYLSNAPQYDMEGNKSIVRSCRKTKQQYVMTEKDGKPTGWSAFFIDGKWISSKK